MRCLAIRSFAQIFVSLGGIRVQCSRTCQFQIDHARRRAPIWVQFRIGQAGSNAILLFFRVLFLNFFLGFCHGIESSFVFRRASITQKSAGGLALS